MSNSLDFIIDVEAGVYREDFEEQMNEMITSGLVWQLQGSWGRLATSFLNSEKAKQEIKNEDCQNV